MPFMLLPYVIILVSIFSLFRNRSNRAMQQRQEEFWEKEQRANLTRKQDISSLDYIKIPLGDFPIGQFHDDKLAPLEKALGDLSGRTILNLSGISNTDLKLQYGAANLPVLSEYDANFTTFARTVAAYGERLAELGHWQEAVKVLEYGVACKTDISKIYTLLGSLYHEHGEDAKLERLKETVRNTDLMLKESILRQLAALQAD